MFSSFQAISFKGNILEWPRSVFAQYVDCAQLRAIAQKLLLLTIATKVCSQLSQRLQGKVTVSEGAFIDPRALMTG